MPRVTVSGVPDWVAPRHLLDGDEWIATEAGWEGERTAAQAADLLARLRNLGMGGTAIDVQVRPALKRGVVRAARTAEARRKRDTTPGFTRPGAQLDDEGRRFLTPERIAKDLARRAVGSGPAATVIDACAGCGGNTIGFARAGCQVVAIEPDARRLALARHNVRVYDVADRVTFLQADARDALPGMLADLVFLDPPWGEPDRIVCHDLPLLDELIAASAHVPRIWAKVPPSFVGRDGFQMEAWFGKRPGDRQRVKFVLLRRDDAATAAQPP